MNPAVNDRKMHVVREFSRADLQAYPSTSKVIGFLEPGAIKVACLKVPMPIVRWVFKERCEKGVLAIKKLWDVKFVKEEDGSIRWSFKSVQFRKSWLTSFIKPPQWYQIDYEAKINVVGSKISRLVTLRDVWTPINEEKHKLQ